MGFTHHNSPEGWDKNQELMVSDRDAVYEHPEDTLAYQTLEELEAQKKQKINRRMRFGAATLASAVGAVGWSGMEVIIHDPKASLIPAAIMARVAYKRRLKLETADIDSRIEYLHERMEERGI